jgi:pseudaminic acid cytidylyltransferase
VILAIIPARGGSVRVPRKNVRLFHGRPMLTYAIDAARASGCFDLIVVSTDDQEIEEVAFANGAVVSRRPIDDGSTGTQELAARTLQSFPTAMR